MKEQRRREQVSVGTSALLLGVALGAFLRLELDCAFKFRKWSLAQFCPGMANSLSNSFRHIHYFQIQVPFNHQSAENIFSPSFYACLGCVQCLLEGCCNNCAFYLSHRLSNLPRIRTNSSALEAPLCLDCRTYCQCVAIDSTTQWTKGPFWILTLAFK